MNSLLLLLACSGNKDTAAISDDVPPGEDQTVTVFASAYVHFGEENLRQIDVPADFPDDSATYSQITGRFTLTCPHILACATCQL
jgi:hypothetical protein